MKAPAAIADGVLPDRDPLGDGEVALAITPQDRDVAGAEVGDGQVEVAVAGEVARHDRRGSLPDRDRLGVGEVALAVARQDRDVALTRVGVGAGDGQVEVTGAGVDRRDRDGLQPDRDRLGDREVALAVARQDRDVVVEAVGDGQDEVAVAGEVARHDRRGGAARDERRAGTRVRKVPSPVPRWTPSTVT